MSGMERLTQRAKRVLSLAHQEAERMRHSYIGTEHLLLGLILEDGGVASRVLREFVAETGFDGIAPLAGEARHAIETARKLTPLITW